MTVGHLRRVGYLSLGGEGSSSAVAVMWSSGRFCSSSRWRMEAVQDEMKRYRHTLREPAR